MKRYVQFLEKQGDDTVEAISSDGVFILDARNTLETQHNDALERMHRLRFVQPYYIGYQIMEGSRFSNSVEISRFIK